MTGTIFDIQRFSIHDGPGIRTTVFFKGCPLRCLWCHNPEGIERDPAISYLANKCIGCGVCFKICQHGVHVMTPTGHVMDRSRCVVCGNCVPQCYAGALELVGREATVEDVLREVRSDRPFYETSGGGMTLSGGEPLMQSDFTLALLTAARQEGLHCVIETCGHVAWSVMQQAAALVDLFLYDYKETDPARHLESTGVSNQRILANLRRLDQIGKPIILRCPIVPGVNDREDHFAGIRQLRRELHSIQDVEIMPYHSLGEGKLARFGLVDFPRVLSRTPEAEEVEKWKTRVRLDAT